MAAICLPLSVMAKQSLEGLAWIDYTSIGILTTGTLTPPEVHVPDDYKGKIQYYVINNDQKVVDCSSDGKSVKLTGAEGTAVVGVFVPTDDKYERIDFKFTVYAAKKFFTINSKSDWDTFCDDYKGEFGVVYLNTDLDLGNKDYVDEFTGLFDGQGHTINLTYTSAFAQYYYAPFYDIKGNLTIKNLNIEGTATTDDDEDRMAGLISCVKSDADVTIDNCRSALRTTYSAPYYGGEFSGFINRANGKTTFRDCSFVGKFNIVSVDVNYIGGFVSKSNNLGNVNFVNCFSDVSGSSFDAYYQGVHTVRPRMIGYFIGRTTSSSTKGKDVEDRLTGMTNCHAVDRGYDDSVYIAKQNLNLVSVDNVADGIAAFKLKAGRTGDDNPWGQTIGTDNEPQLQVFSPESKEVYHADAGTQDYGTSTWATFYYPEEVSIPDGVITYQMAGTDDGQIIADDILSESNKDKPLLLRAADGIGNITLPEVYYNRYEKTGILRPVYEQTAAADDWYVLQTTDEGDVQFAAPETATSLDAWTCYSTEPVEGIATSNIEIKSKTDWDIFKTRYSGKNVDALLSCDLKLTEDDAPMESLVGTFNGQGHTITVDYTSPNYRTTKTARAPFRTASGTIKNLRVDGNIINDAGNSGTMYAAPFVYKMEEDNTTLNVENCVSAVNFFIRQKPLTFGGSNATSFFGGFIEDVGTESSTGIVVNFKDCSYLGSITGRSYTDPDKGTTTSHDKVNSCGGFVGKLRKATACLQNCYSDTKVTLNEASSSAAIYDFVLNHSDEGTVNITNCYARKAYFAEGKELSHDEGVSVMTDAQVKSGEVAYRLRAGGDAWRQTIGTDTIPQLATFYGQSKVVYGADGGDYKLGTTGWGTLYYPTDVTLADGVKAYTVSSVKEETTDGKTENYVELTTVEGSTLPAYTAAILCSLADGESAATEKTIPLVTLYYNDPKEQTEGESLLLRGVLESTETKDGWYIMQNQGGKVAFYQVDTEVAQPTLPAFRCALLWVPKEDEQASAKVNLRIDDETTGISNILEPLLQDGNVYDLEGRRVQTLQKNRIYIKNGRKFIVR